MSLDNAVKVSGAWGWILAFLLLCYGLWVSDLPLEQSQPLELQKWNLSFLSYKVGLLEVGLFLIHLRGWESEYKWAQSFLFREMKMF